MTKLLIPAAALMVAASSLAFAAGSHPASTIYAAAPKPAALRVAASTPAAQCTALEQQFGKAESTHKTMKDFAQAAKLRDQGKSLCSANKAPDGVKKLEQALRMIGVTPSVKS